ncbi:MAG: hypothetical protein A2Y41_07745 [Spirochaetes bacterium GWB1_36_13]|nr:MAG: hypothetical protein A2Y41_07745 [Spirochaetes bacterium GWB1_36_13]
MKKMAYFCIALLFSAFSQLIAASPQDDLFQAVKTGDEEGLKKALNLGASLYQKDFKGQTPLQYSIKLQKIKITKLLIAEMLYPIYKSGGDHFGYAATVMEILKSDGITPRNFQENESYRQRESIDFFSLFSGGLAIRESLQIDTIEQSTKEEKIISIKTLEGPVIDSHPFEKMVKGKKFQFSDLARLIPEDFYYLQAQSLKKALEIADYITEKGTAVYKKYNIVSVDYHIKEKIMNQLALKENKAARIFYDSVIDEMAITGSDPFFRNGTDITLIFKLKNKIIFKTMVESYRKDFIKDFQAEKKEIQVEKWKADFIFTPDRKIYSYFMELDDNRVIISNSFNALKKVAETYLNKQKSMADAKDFQYMQSLYFEDQTIKDITLYLSDSFIRYLVSPELRIKESRRMAEALRLSVMERLSLFYYQLTEKKPDSVLKTLKAVIPDTREAEKYFNNISLENNGFTAVSSEYGRNGWLVPNIDTQISLVSEKEAENYKKFVDNYSNYWKDFFDPIGIQFNFNDEKIHIVTQILPLINLSIYDSLQKTLGGFPVILSDSFSIKNEIFKIAFKLTQEMKKEIASDFPDYQKYLPLLGDSVSLHLLDTHTMVDFDSQKFLGQIFSSSSSALNTDYLGIAFLAWSFFHPIRLSIPLNGSEASKKMETLIDHFLQNLNSLYPYSYFYLSWDFYSYLYQGKKIRVMKMNFFNIFSLRYYILVDQELHITTTENYMKSLVDALVIRDTPKKANLTEGNVLLSIRPSAMDQEKSVFTANMMEAYAGASFKNHTTLELVKIMFPDAENLSQKAFEVFGFEPVCPVKGNYIFNEEKNEIESSVFGSKNNPLFNKDYIDAYLEKTIYKIQAMKISLEFTKDGIKTHIIVE